jgi:hypothetical protein
VLQETLTDGRLLRLEPPPELAPALPSFFLPPKLPMLHGLRDGQGYVAVFLRHYRDLFDALAPGTTESVGIRALPDLALLERPLLDVLGIEAVVFPLRRGAAPPPPPSGWEPVAMPDASFKGQPFQVICWRNREYPGRAFVVPTVQTVRSEQEMIAELAAPSFPGRREARVLAADYEGPRDVGARFPETAPLPFAPPPPVAAAENCRLVHETCEELIFDVRTRGGLLVQNDCYYPGWRVQVDGEDHPLLRVDHALRGVLLSPGEHEVRFYFRPLSVYAGVALGIISLLSLLLLAATQRSPRGSRS